VSFKQASSLASLLGTFLESELGFSCFYVPHSYCTNYSIAESFVSYRTPDSGLLTQTLINIYRQFTQTSCTTVYIISLFFFNIGIGL